MQLNQIQLNQQVAYRLISSKFPPIDIFDDVADADEFTALYALQSLTNPRLQNQVGNLNLLPSQHIPFGITGCSYACAPFTHVNPNGSRFSDGQFGVLYMADSIETALAEVLYHQQKYWSNVEGLNYDSLVMRGLQVTFSGQLVDLCRDDLPLVYDQDDYHAAQALGQQLRKDNQQGLQYYSVRKNEGTCWGLFTPKLISQVLQSKHYEFIFSGRNISSVRQIKSI